MPSQPPLSRDSSPLTLHLLGIDFSWASVAGRELLAFDRDQALALLQIGRAHV